MTWYSSLSRAFLTASIPNTYARETEHENSFLYKAAVFLLKRLGFFFWLSYRENLHNVVGRGPDRIDVLLAEDPHEAHSVRLEDPLLQGLELTILRDDDLLLIVSLGQVHVHLGGEECHL